MSARRRIDQKLVVQTAIQLADANGFEAVTLAAVAEKLEIRIPSLYNHVSGLPGLQYLMSVWAAQTLGDLLRRAAVGKAGQDAVMSMGIAYRAFAHTHPGLYRTTLRAPRPDEPELTAAAQELLDLLLAVLQPFGLNNEEMLHTIRGLRSVLHGFIDLEIAGGFGMALDRDESFYRLLHGFVAGIKITSPAQTAAD
ncbi:MAG: WHG domain-containing protein [Anaerolineae bacterium]|nr:WHG domain-containing protein [Anaerolineae bacterium]